VVALVLAGCGGGPDRLTKDELFSKVVAAQAKAGSSHVAMTLTSPNGQKISSRGQMLYGDKPEDTALAMTTGGANSQLGAIEVRLVDRAYYIRIGALTGEKFARIDLTDKDNPIARQYGDVIENIDPGRQIRQYRAAVTAFDNSAEPVEIDGVETIPYKVTVDPSKVKAFKNADVAGDITYTLYVGPDNLPRRMVSGMPAASGGTRLRIDYTNWGEKVVIKAPAKSKIETEGPLAALAG
jgi:hypothetical protein